MKETKNIIKKEILDLIPNTVQERRRFIRKQLGVLCDSSVFCPAIGTQVKVESKSIVEIAQNAAVSVASTVAALNLANLLQNAEYEKMDMPSSATQKNKFQAAFMIHLRVRLTGFGIAKVLVAATEHNGVLYYSATIPPK